MDNNKLGFGLMRLPRIDNVEGGEVDVELVKALVDKFISRGFTYFDTAWMYCNFTSECVAKQAIVDRYPRDAFTLTDKLHAAYFKTEEERDAIFAEQIKKTGVDFFDYYLLHDVNRRSFKKFERLNCYSFIKEKKAQGFAKHIGFSFHDGPELLEEVLTAWPEMEYVQLQLNYVDWDSAGVRSHECYDVAVKHGKRVIVMEPVKGGTLAALSPDAEKILRDYAPEASLPSWAIRFAASNEAVFKVLSGMSNMDQVLDNTSYMADFKPLNAEERACIDKVVGVIRDESRIACTGCSYCTAGCPQNITIPRYFSLFNADLQEIDSKGWKPQVEYYDNLCKEFGAAGDCIECGACEEICPQHLPVRKYLKQVKEHFGK